MGGLREEGYEKIGEDEIWREGTADRKLWKVRTESVARQYFTCPSPLYSREQGGRAQRTPVQQGTRRKSTENPCTAGNKEEEHTSVIYM